MASEEGVASGSDAREVVELAALLHDIADWKYSGSDTAGVEAARAFLSKHGYPHNKVRRVARGGSLEFAQHETKNRTTAQTCTLSVMLCLQCAR